jgi:hypothetical protein
MIHRFIVCVAVSLALCLGVASLVSADVFVEDTDVSCDSFGASGTTDSPYIIIHVDRVNTNGSYTTLATQVFAANGTFNRTVHFEEQESGTILDLFVTGLNSSNPSDIDGGFFYYRQEPCESDGDGSEAGPPCENLFDGRLNDHQGLDCAAPVAIYLNADLGTVDIYAVNPDTGEGTLVIRQSSAGTSQVDSNQLVESVINPFTGATISLYWLTSNEWELRTTYSDGKWYDFVWNADGVRYHLAA